LREPNLGKTNPRVTPLILLAICFAPSLADSIIFLTLTRLVVVLILRISVSPYSPPSRRLSFSLWFLCFTSTSLQLLDPIALTLNQVFLWQ
jgi:hypothetical protein